MKHQLCKEFYAYWESHATDGNLPHIEHFSHEKMQDFLGCGVIYSLCEGDIYLDYIGPQLKQVMPQGVEGMPLTRLYSPSLMATQVALFMPCFISSLGVTRYSRCWFSHRHKDVETILLPVEKPGSDSVVMVGVSVAFVATDEKDKISTEYVLTERILKQNFLTFGNKADFNCIDAHTWAVLDTMGARLCVDGQDIAGEDSTGLIGQAGVAAAKLARPNVLAVANGSDFGHIAGRLGGRYNLKIVETLEEARTVLTSDLIDILVALESYNEGTGKELIEEAQKISAFTACVLMLDQGDETEDSAVITDDSYVQCLVQPVGEFALRKVLDDASDHVTKRIQSGL